MKYEEITRRIIGCAMRVHSILGNGFQEVIYQRALAIEKGSGAAGRESVGKLSRAQLREIAQLKLKDLNANSIEAAERVVEGAARSMGIEVE